MAKYEPGIKTRKKILKTCKKLFYDKGYDDTTYDEICQEGNTNKGVLYYHFKTKYHIGRTIFSEFLVKNYRLVSKILDEKYGEEGYKYLEALHLRSYLSLLHNDEKLRRFYHQITNVAKFTADYAGVMEETHKRYSRACNLNLSDNDIKFLTSVIMGASASTYTMFLHGYFDISFEEYMDYRVRIFHSMMGMEKNQVNHIVEESKTRFQDFNLGVKKYFEPYIIKDECPKGLG